MHCEDYVVDFMKKKIQISITKFQINIKLQYAMTQTFTPVGSHCFAKARSAGDNAIVPN
jgi:hypothetical protein